MDAGKHCQLPVHLKQNYFRFTRMLKKVATYQTNPKCMLLNRLLGLLGLLGWLCIACLDLLAHLARLVRLALERNASQYSDNSSCDTKCTISELVEERANETVALNSIVKTLELS